jgi:hypothetical protein
MIKELWGAFPRLIEQNIASLLDGAEPNPTRAFLLYKSCKNESLWDGGFEKFSRELEIFFAKPKATRKKSDFDRVLSQPMDQSLFADFHLTFRTAIVSEKALGDLASWAYNLIRVSRKSSCEAASLTVMTKTLQYITNPPPFEKAQNVLFEDFCHAWKKTVFKIFGNKHDQEFQLILSELEQINAQLKEDTALNTLVANRPLIYLTQTETDWTLAVREAALSYAAAPKFPLAKGPSKKLLLELEKVVSLYGIVFGTQLPELVQHRENVRATILDRCAALLGETLDQRLISG